MIHHSFENCKLFSELVEPLSRKRDPNITPNEHVYGICCRPEVGGDVISGENVKTIECYALLNFEAASCFLSKSAICVMPKFTRLYDLLPTGGSL